MKDTLQKIKTLLAKDYDVDPTTVTLKSKLRSDLGLDSLDLTEAILAIEDAFNFEFDDDAVDSLETLEDMCAYIEEHTK